MRALRWVLLKSLRKHPSAAAVQVTVRPPTFAIFCNDPSLFGETYRRYLEQVRPVAVRFMHHPVHIRQAAVSILGRLYRPMHIVRTASPASGRTVRISAGEHALGSVC